MKKYKKIWTLIGLFLIFFPAYIFFFGTQRALAYDTSSQVKQCVGSLKFIDVAHIQCSDGNNTVNFTDKDPTDGTDNYAADAGVFCTNNQKTNIGLPAYPVSPGDSSGINLNLGGRLGVSDSSGPITSTVNLTYPSGSNCVPYGTPDGSSSIGVPNQGQTTNLPKNVTIDQPGNVLNLLTWNGENIVNLPGVSSGSLSGKNFSRISGEDPSNGNLLFGSGDFSASNCSGSVIAVSPLGNSGTEYELLKGSGNLPDDLSTLLSGDGCSVSKINFGMSDYSGTTFGIGGTAPSDLQWNNSGSPGQPGGGGGSTGGSVQKGGACNAGSDCKGGVCQKDQGDCQNDSCAQLSASPFSWFLCPALDIAQDASNTLLNIFEGQLSFSISDLNGSNACKVPTDPNACQEKVKRAWSVIRDLSSAMLVIIMLVMVISQAVSWGPFDAYAIKKMLPRIVIAVILIQISWDLFAWVVDLVNGVGKGLADLMYYPFGGSANLDLGSLLANANIGNTTGSSVTWGLLAILGAIAGTILAVAALPALIVAAITAIFSLLTGIIALMFRKVLIIMCLIFSPLALLLWILPGTQSYYKLWKDNFTKALMMFPLVVAIVAAGRIFAYITGTQDTGVASVVLNFIFIMVGYFAPLFILPKTFKWGGSLMSTVGGTIQNTLKPAAEGTSKFTKEWAQRKQGSWANKLDYNERTGRFAKTRRIAGIGLRRVQSGHILPTKHDRKLAIQQGDKWAAEENEIAAAYSNRVYGKALENGYNRVRTDDNGNLLDENNNIVTDPSQAAVDRMEPGVGAAKQALVDLAHHSDARIAKGAITQLIKTSSWPEIQSARDSQGRRVFEERDDNGDLSGVNRAWTQTLAKDPDLYPAVLKSRVDLASHILERSGGREGQMLYALTEQMDNHAFTTQSDGFWNEVSNLAQSSPQIRTALQSRLEAIAQTGTSGQQILGHLAGGPAAETIDEALGGPGSLSALMNQAVTGVPAAGAAGAAGGGGGGVAGTGAGGAIPVGGVVIGHGGGGGTSRPLGRSLTPTEQRRIQTGNDSDIQNFVVSNATAGNNDGWEQTADEYLIHIYDTKSGSLKDRAETELRRRGIFH